MPPQCCAHSLPEGQLKVSRTEEHRRGSPQEPAGQDQERLVGSDDLRPVNPNPRPAEQK